MDKQCIIFPDKSTESFAIIDEEKNNTTSGRIVEKKANIIYSENATDEKKNISIDLREAHEFAQVRSGKDSKPARKNCGNVSYCMVYVVQYMSLESIHITTLRKIDIMSQIWI